MLPEARAPRPGEIAVIDLAEIDSPDPAVRARLAEEVARASRDVGFFYIVNHGIPAASVAHMFDTAEKFFDLPVEAKNEVAIAKSPLFRGYIPSNHIGTDPKLKANLQEAFQIHLDLPPDDPDVRAGKPMHGPNPWPSAMPRLKPDMTAYQQQMWALGRKLLPLFAIGLGLAPDALDRFFTKPMIMLRLLHYPPQAPDDSTESIGTRAHTDTGVFTILAQDTVGGLEIMTKSGEWITMPPIPDSYVVNLGEMMKAWSDAIFTSTPHRVVNRYGLERYSVPFFVNPDFETAFTPLVTNPNPVDVPQFHSSLDRTKGIRIGDWMVSLYSRIYPSPWKTAAQ
ncbi:MAG: isopenicillin N synthase family dioxygenase [Alphaproteobacteria bacterium]